MRALYECLARLERAVDPRTRVDVWKAYWQSVPALEAAHALWLATGGYHGPTLGPAFLKRWAAEKAGLPTWLIDESAKAVGDLPECLALVLPAPPSPVPWSLSDLTRQRLLPLAGATREGQRKLVHSTWEELDPGSCQLWNRLLAGRLASAFDQDSVVDALAELAHLPHTIIRQRLAEPWAPSAASWHRLLSPPCPEDTSALPFEFAPIIPLPEPALLPEVACNAIIEWQWDGIRAQLIRRAGRANLWSVDGRSLADRFPEILRSASLLPDGTVLEGDLVAWSGDRSRPLSDLPRPRSQSGPEATAVDHASAVFLARDLLEFHGRDHRDFPLVARRAALAEILVTLRSAPVPVAVGVAVDKLTQTDLFAPPLPPVSTETPCPIRLAPSLDFESLDQLRRLREQCRSLNRRGLVFRPRDSRYRAHGTDVAHRWTLDSHRCLAVLVAIHAPESLTGTAPPELNLALRRHETWVTVARVPLSTLSADGLALEAFVRENTIRRFGPVRSVVPTQVFELAFEDLTPSTRHKSGWILLSPRVLRWCRDLSADQAGSIDTLETLFARTPAE